MKIETHNRYRRVTIQPGEYYSTAGAEVISTLLGSCVAVCLYDPGLRLIGMNHFMLAGRPRSGDESSCLSESGRFGLNAMELLINQMMARGTDRSRLRAKVFGGATLMGSGNTSSTDFYGVGRNNCEFVRSFLATEGIPVDAEDLGGDFGRVIHFSNGDFAVFRRKIHRNRSTGLVKRDRECWLNAIRRQERSMPKIDLW